MAQNAPPNGILTANNPRGPVGGNRKKQKRRAKQAMRSANDPDDSLPSHVSTPDAQPPSLDEVLSDEDYHQHVTYAARPPLTNGLHPYPANDDAVEPAPKKRNKKKKRTNSDMSPHNPGPHMASTFHHTPLPHPPPPPVSAAPLRSGPRSSRQDRIWNTSTQEERERIKEFWLTLSEDERKSLLKIEKEAVLRKMKEQQKHSCSCTVCGRKRVAIEEELEVLYDAYYNELEQYAHHQGGDSGHGMLPHPRSYPPAHHIRPSSAVPLPLSTQHAHPHHRTSRVHEIIDDDDDDDDDDDEEDDQEDEGDEVDSQDLSEEEEEEYSDEEDDLYSDEEDEPEDDMPRGIGADFFNFGNSLTVKGGILTVADDLLKNDGKKFIEMMEQLAERRMQREQEAEYASSQPAHSYGANGHDAPLDDEEYDDEEDEYDSQEELEDDEEEEDEMGGMTEEQRMEEGRRMFQIFAARMFEQRVLTAYREKVAAERQKKLLEELEDETKLQAEREAKKARDAEKRKNKKLAQKQAKAEEKAKKDAEKAAEEAAAKAIEEKKQEEARRRKEEQRKKKEAERKAQEEEKQRKEAERLKRQQEERDRQQETERKLREQKALEKKQRDEARQKEREEREVREKEIREKKAQNERERKEREVKAKADKEARQNLAKRPSQVAVPPGLLSKQTPSALSSPHVSVATPALSKLSTPAQQRQNSHQGPHTASPKSQQTPAMAPTKSTSPTNGSNQPTPRSILQKPSGQPPQLYHSQSISPTSQLPQPGMHPQQHTNGFGGFPSGIGGFSGFHTPHNPMMHHRPSLPGFPQAPMGNHFQPFQNNSPMSGPPPGMSGLGLMSQGRGFPHDGPAGFAQQMAPSVGSPNAPPGFGMPRHTMPTHSRTHSSDKTMLDSLSSPAPITRPTPIQRPSSVKPGSADVDDLSRHLGSSALLDDADEPLPTVPEGRRQSAAAGPRTSAGMGFGSPIFAPSHPRMDVFAANSSWSSPSMFGAPPGLSAPSSSWGANISSGWPAAPFGNLGHRPSGPNRPLMIRLAVCQACKQLAVREPTPDNFHPVETLIRQIEANRPLLDTPITLKEIEDICETEGDSHNGGGLLHVRHNRSIPGGFAVKFESGFGTPKAQRPPQSLGEIGSPMPGHSIPAGFGGAPTDRRGTGFQSLGSAMATPGFS